MGVKLFGLRAVELGLDMIIVLTMNMDRESQEG